MCLDAVDGVLSLLPTSLSHLDVSPIQAQSSSSDVLDLLKAIPTLFPSLVNLGWNYDHGDRALHDEIIDLLPSLPHLQDLKL